MHRTIEPTILYFGTPVAIISSLNEDGSANLAPMSSAWWLGWSCMLGLGQMGQTSANLLRTRECVINLPAADQVANVDRLAMTTDRNPVPEKKRDSDHGRAHIDPMKWRPLIMSFCRFFGVGDELHPSRLAGSNFMKLVSRPAAAQLAASR